MRPPQLHLLLEVGGRFLLFHIPFLLPLRGLGLLGRPRLGTVSARAGGEGGEGEGGGCEGKGERGGDGRVSVTRSTWGTTLRVQVAASRDPTGLRCQE